MSNGVQWMYDKSKEDSEVYLLGKAVSDPERLEKLGRDYEESSSQRLARIDMETKYREDPLTVMKQRESEKRTELLKNTAKIRKLHRLLAIQKHKNEHPVKRRKTKKHRTRSRSKSVATTSSSSSGDELLNEFVKIIRQSDEKEGNDESLEINQCSTLKSDRTTRTKACYREQPKPQQYQNCSTSTRQKMSKEETETRRMQMIGDAKEYQKLRAVRIKHHLIEKSSSERLEEKNRSRHGASFISTLKNSHTQLGSVEDGVRRNAASYSNMWTRLHLIK